MLHLYKQDKLLIQYLINMNEDWLTQQKKEQELLNMSMKESFRQRDERKMKEPYTIIHTKEFNCADDHPIV